MIFVRLAIGRRPSGSFENSTCPVSRSARSALGAEATGGTAASDGVSSDCGNGESDPSGGTGVGGGGASCAEASPMSDACARMPTATTSETRPMRGRRWVTRSAGRPAGWSGGAPA